jgi:hypothetical protein
MEQKLKFAASAVLIVVIELALLLLVGWLGKVVLGQTAFAIICLVLLGLVLFVAAYGHVRKHFILRRRMDMVSGERLNSASNGKLICTHEQMNQMAELGLDVTQARFVGSGALFDLSEIMSMLMIPEVTIKGRWSLNGYSYVIEYNDGKDYEAIENEVLLDAGVQMIVYILRLQGRKTKAEEENGE